MKNSLIEEINTLYDLEVDRDHLVPMELAIKLADISCRINREIAVYINRKGNILDVSIGDSTTVSLGEVEGRKSMSRFSGVRCIHTHPNGDGHLSFVDINSFLKLRLDSMIAIGVDEGTITEIFAAIPNVEKSPKENDDFLANDINQYTPEIWGPFSLEDESLNSIMDLIIRREKDLGSVIHEVEQDNENAILVGLETGSGQIIDGKSEAERSLDELEELAMTAGARVVHKIIQKKATKDPAFFVGRGKVEEIGLLRQALNASLVIYDDELSGAQVKNIEEVTGIKVIDRTTLILDIFAQRAKSMEGKLQVELAQLKYRLHRLIGLGGQLSRLGGGIGTRGPGEKKLEVDRRHIRRRVSILEEDLRNISGRRALLREGRKRKEVPVVALVGYTNAGKSTLMNALCNADVFAEDKLFATLDPTTRKLILPDGREVLLVDTVGFIRKLPHDLVEAFKSTLEEAVFADILLHVVDASSVEAETQIKVVEELLSSLGAIEKPSIMVYNKMDIAKDNDISHRVEDSSIKHEVSAVKGDGLEELLSALSSMLSTSEVKLEFLVPYSDGWAVSYLHENGRNVENEYIEDGILIKATIKKSKLNRVKNFVKA